VAAIFGWCFASDDSKALSCFTSDRSDFPKDDYDVKEINGGLLPN